MGWFERVTRADRDQAMDTLAELQALRCERERLMQVGLTGSATIVGIRQNVARTGLGAWHELALDVRLPDRGVYRATCRVALELSTAPHIKVGADVPVLVDPDDRSTVIVVANL